MWPRAGKVENLDAYTHAMLVRAFLDDRSRGVIGLPAGRRTNLLDVIGRRLRAPTASPSYSGSCPPPATRSTAPASTSTRR